jgi:hypothetical protein
MAHQFNQTQRVLASEFSARANSKYEIYQFLSIDAEIYLPKCNHVTIYFLKEVISGEKKGKLF